MLGEIIKSLLVYCVVPLFSNIPPHPDQQNLLSTYHHPLRSKDECGWSHILDESINIKKLAGPYAADVIKYSKESKVSPLLIAAILHVENNGFIHNSMASHRVSYAGAIGPMQLMPSTGRFMHVNPWVPKENIKGGVKYVAYLLKSFHYNITDALIAYNEGPTVLKQGYKTSSSIAYASRIIRISKS